MLYRVLALDPGGTTGWATYTAEKMWIGDLPAEEKVEYYDEKWACGQIEHQDHHNALDQFLGFMQTEAFVIVCEGVHPRQGAPGKQEDQGGRSVVS
jgi:hypothetical protein